MVKNCNCANSQLRGEYTQTGEVWKGDVKFVCENHRMRLERLEQVYNM